MSEANETKWYVKVITALLVVVFSPLIILLLLIATPFFIRESRRTKKEYYKSAYYADFKKNFTLGITYDPAYRFYNGAKARNLPVRYVHQNNGHLYFFCGDTLYLFPDFEQLSLSEEDGTTWQADYDGDWMGFSEAYAKLMENTTVTSPGPVKILVERRMIVEGDLVKTPPPSCIHVVHSYETAFENDDTALTLRIPQSSAELYDMMQKTPDLCGEYALTEDGESIRWRVREDIQITLGVDPHDCCMSVERLLLGKSESGITHWHPTPFEMYDEVCKIGRRGNVLVLRRRAGSSAVLYSGRKEDCPYKPDQKVLFGKYYYIEAK